ncbi:hypothetical protein Tco_0222645 [Tanacetum coccineum]
MEAGEKAALMKKAYCTLILCLGDRVLQEVTKETTAAGIWTKLTSLYMTKSLANRRYLKKKLYTYNMSPCTKLGDHIHEFNKLILDLANIDIEIEDEDQTLMLLTSLPSSYENFVEILLYGRESLTMEDVLANLNSRKGRSDYLGKAHSSGSSRFKSRGGTGGSYHMTHRRDFLYDFKVVDGGSVQFGDNKTCIIKGTRKVKIQLHDGSSFILEDVRLSGYDDWDQEKELCVYFGSKSDEFWCIKAWDSKQVGFKQLGVKQGAQGNHEAGVFQDQEKGHLGIKVGANITVIGVPGQEGGEGNVAEKKKVKESMEANLGKLLKYNGRSTR